MPMDLSNLSIPKLRALSARIQLEIQRRDKHRRTDLLKRMELAAKEAGFTLADVLGAKPVEPASKTKTPLPIRYRHPSDIKLAWSGRGPKPAWVKAWIGNGGAMAALETAAEKFAARQARVVS